LKRKYFRLLALVFALAMLAGVLGGCSSEKSAAMFKVNGDKVSKADFMMYVFFTKCQIFSDELSNGSVSMSTLYQLPEEQLEEEVEIDVTFREYLKYLAASQAMSSVLMRQMAQDAGVKITKADKDELKAVKADFVETLGGAAAYNKFIKAIGSTDSAYDRYMTDVLYSEKLYELYADGEKFALTEPELAAGKEEFAKSYVTVRHILFNVIDLSSGNYLSAEEQAKAQVDADAVLALIRGGADFTEMMEQYTAEAKPAPFTFTEGEVLPEFEEAALKLAVGEVSDVVKTLYGYHIIIRDPLQTGGTAWENYKEILREQKYSADVQEKSDSAKITTTKAYDKLKVS